eukprot:scaffold22591_cov125-Cylindrotheca_fusiformis.AAC.7
MSLRCRTKILYNFLQKKNKLARLSSRSIVVSSAEPPLDSDVVEKPISVILMEDRFLYNHSWQNSFQDSIPLHHGMPFSSLAFPGQATVNELLDSLKADISRIPDPVLVARGPRSSWVAQLYLESLFLRGLVMVDPILLDKLEEVENEAVALVRNSFSKTEKGTTVEEWHAFVEEAQSRELKLEPNSIPMLVLNSNTSLLDACRRVAERHSDSQGLFGEVPVLQVDDSLEQTKHQQGIIEEIDGWIATIY